MIVSNSSPLPSKDQICSFSKKMATPRAVNSRRVASSVTVFRVIKNHNKQQKKKREE
jgi:hypothetical protein